MKRNTLYTINKNNKWQFAQNIDRVNNNIFDGFNTSLISNSFADSFKNSAMNTQLPTNLQASAKAQQNQLAMNQYKQQQSQNTAKSVGMGVASAIPDQFLDDADPLNALAGGRHSNAGGTMQSVGKTLFKSGASSGSPYMMLAGGIAQALGSLTNSAFGYNIQNEGRINDNINKLSNYKVDDSSYDSIINSMNTNDISDIGLGKVSNGWFNHEGTKRAAELKKRQDNAIAFANNSNNNALYNVQQGINDTLLSNYAAYGGKLFGYGGINDAKMSLLDNFGSNPLGAVLQYNKSLQDYKDQIEAQQESKRQQMAFNDMQSQLENQRTINSGLQSMLDSQSLSINQLQNNHLQNDDTYNWRDYAVQNAKNIIDSTEGLYDNSASKYNIGTLRKGLQKRGITNPITQDALLANIMVESKGVANAKNPNSSAKGLMQWLKDRHPAKWDLNSQLDYIANTYNQVGNGNWSSKQQRDKFLASTNPYEAARLFRIGYERPEKETYNLTDKWVKSMHNTKAFGGELGTNGADFTNGLLQINNGGSHESNPYGGVQIGVDQEGKPNRVEEGETVFNNYVFSNRIPVPDFVKKQFGINKNKQVSFADLSKRAARESKETPNDPISKAGLQASLNILQQAQEYSRQQMNAQQSNIHALGDWLDTLNLDKFTKYSDYKPNKKDAYAFYNTDSNTQYRTPDNSGFAYYKNNQYDKGYLDFVNKASDSDLSAIATKIQPYTGNLLTPDQLRKNATDINSGGGYGVAHEALGQYYSNYLKGNNTDKLLPATNNNISSITGKDEYITQPIKNYDTRLRYAPVWGSVGMALSDMAGLTNKPDYTYADKIEAAANRSGYAPNISYNPIGDYMKYTPLDRDYYSNKLSAESGATRNAILNSGATPSRSAAILASDYNSQGKLGDLFRQAEEYNLGQRERVATFNRGTNQFNSEQDLHAKTANAQFRQSALNASLSGLSDAARMREAIDARVSAARSANITNALNNLGNIGRENFAINQLNNSGYDYTINKDGSVNHKDLIKKSDILNSQAYKDWVKKYPKAAKDAQFFGLGGMFDLNNRRGK